MLGPQTTDAAEHNATIAQQYYRDWRLRWQCPEKKKALFSWNAITLKKIEAFRGKNVRAYRSAMASTSTSASLGSRATCTQLRAGQGSPKYSA